MGGLKALGADDVLNGVVLEGLARGPVGMLEGPLPMAEGDVVGAGAWRGDGPDHEPRPPRALYPPPLAGAT